MSIIKAPVELWRILGNIAKHPLTKNHKAAAVARFLRWQIASRAVNWPILCPYVNESRLLLSRGLGGGGYAYLGLLEYNEMAFLLHFLRADDHFVDIGAYIGAYTVLASAVCRASTTAFEPAPASFKRLCDNIRANRAEELVTAIHAGVGRENALLPFTTALGTGNHRIKDNRPTHDAVQVPVRRLDDVITSDFPIALKIDGEGAEEEIIEGAAAVLGHANLRCVIIELWHDPRLWKVLEAFEFKLYTYDPLVREIRAADLYSPGDNAICLRDTDFINQRITLAPRFSLFGEIV